MKQLIRLTESELHNIVIDSVRRILREDNGGLVLQNIAQSILGMGNIDVECGSNEQEIPLQGGDSAYLMFTVECDPYMQQGVSSSDYDVPDDPSEIIDDPRVYIDSIEYYSGDGEGINLQDNGIIAKALERVIRVDYGNMDIPSGEEYFYNEY